MSPEELCYFKIKKVKKNKQRLGEGATSYRGGERLVIEEEKKKRGSKEYRKSKKNAHHDVGHEALGRAFERPSKMTQRTDPCLQSGRPWWP